MKTIHKLLKIKHRYSFDHNILRGTVDQLFDYQSLISEPQYTPRFSVFDNNVYGIGTALIEYSGLNSDPSIYIEHGLFFGSYLQGDQLFWFTPKFLCMGTSRADFLAKSLPGKQVYAIGPYISYANGFISDASLKELKTELGKVILLFPSHSTKNVDMSYDISVIDKQVNLTEEHFDNKFVCLYYIDAQKTEVVEAYEQLGYKVVCAGSKYEQSFLSRLKSIILLSDLIITNNIGTHLGYCVALNKRISYLKDEIKRDAKNKLGAKMIENVQKKRFSYEQKKEIAEAFTDFPPEITAKQYEVANKFWGIDQIRSKEELARILS